MDRIAIACDHGGYDLKEAIKLHYAGRLEFVDFGTNSNESVDYPEYAQDLAQAIINGDISQGILICGTGIGMSIAANRYPQIRAALCTDTTMALRTRLHNDANVLALGARIIGTEVAFDIIDVFLGTGFEGGRHERRVEKLSITD